MRLIQYITFPNEEFNAAVHDGSMNGKMARAIEESRPEFIYFTENGGNRGAIAVVEIKNDAEIPRVCERWFLDFNAKIEMRIAMSSEDLQKANLDQYREKG